MIEGYTTKETIECYVDYIKNGKPMGVPVSRHHGTLSWKVIKGENHSMVLLMKEFMRHILASYIS
jgi:hypothetical protein